MASERGPASEVVLAFDDEGESHSIHGSAYADEEAMADTLVRNPSLTRNHTGLSQDPYRSDTIPASLYGETGGRFSTSSSFRVDPRSGQPRAGFPWRSAFAAFVLFAFGITFLLLGTLHFRDKDHGTFVAFTTIGALTFLPGAYASYNLYHAIRGTPGWHLSDFAHFDDYRW